MPARDISTREDCQHRVCIQELMASLDGGHFDGAREDDHSHLRNRGGGFTCWMKIDELTLLSIQKKGGIREKV